MSEGARDPPVPVAICFSSSALYIEPRMMRLDSPPNARAKRHRKVTFLDARIRLMRDIISLA